MPDIKRESPGPRSLIALRSQTARRPRVYVREKDAMRDEIAPFTNALPPELGDVATAWIEQCLAGKGADLRAELAADLDRLKSAFAEAMAKVEEELSR
jgi:hypothetical protein